MTDYEAPRLRAPRLSDLLGRSAPDLDLVRLRRRTDSSPPPRLDPGDATLAALRPHLQGVHAGDTVAIGVGSRGIRGIDRVVAAVVGAVRERGADPFVVPAMGSHGGADAPGQEATLRRLGVDEGLGAPVRATMETVPIGRADDVSVRFDALAATADHILVVNRLKSHTSFSGRIESGLAKMLSIGCGKQSGAEELHRLGPSRIEDRIVAAARFICDALPVLGGIALVEGRDKDLVAVEFVAADEIGGAREAELLAVAKSHEARLPFTSADVLVVDQMGKEFSGTGMDTNVIGRRMVRSMPELAEPSITHVVCLEISEKSGGNAVGVGLADFVPHRLLQGFDPLVTYANTLTAGSQGVQRAQIPIVLADDVAAVSAAILTCDLEKPAQLRLCRIRNTLHLDEVLVTETLAPEAQEHGYDVIGRSPLWGEEGRLAAW
jgi:hypothetical protein